MEAGGKPIVVLNKNDAEDLGIKSSDRVSLQTRKRKLTAIVNITTKLIKRGWIGVYEEVRVALNLKEGREIEVEIARFPKSLDFIRNKLKGRKLTYDEIYEIVKDVIEGSLNDIEISAFVTSLHDKGLDLDEATNLSIAMVETGEKLKLNKKIVADKHSVTYDTPVIVRENKKIKIEKIGKIVDEILDDNKGVFNLKNGSQFKKIEKNLEVLAFDQKLNIMFRRVTGVYRHPTPKKLLKITLLGNREVTVTESHSLFRINKGKVEVVPGNKVNVGDFLLVPRRIQLRSKIDDINLIEELIKLEDVNLHKIYVKGAKEFLPKKVRKLLTTSQKRYDLIPLALIKKYKIKIPKKRNIKIKIKNGKAINAFIPISKEFVRILGYFAAEGFINQNGISIDFGAHEKSLREDAKKCVKNVFGIAPTENFPHKTAVHICIYNKLLGFIFEKIFKTGRKCSEKRIPEIIFNLNKVLQKEFLKAYLYGDGYFRRNYEAIAVTVSDKLKTDLMYLCNILGISFSTSRRSPGIREFSNGYRSPTKETHILYLQANPIFNRKSNTAAYINFVPLDATCFRELAHNPVLKGWENRRILRRQRFITFKKASELLKVVNLKEATKREKIIIEKLKNLTKGDVGFLPVKKIEEVSNYDKKYVYDLCVEGYENFVGGNGAIFLHNSIGGVPGHKTTMILVPIIASCGIAIPKTSSRAITSASGTADTAETLMPVSLDVEEMKRVVEKTDGCIVWGGSLHLAPADDIFVRIEYPLSIDPLMIPSIMAKKKAVGATHLIIDIPCGRGTKVKTIGDADLLAKDFIEVGRRLGIRTRCAVTYGEQPIGYTIGPALEAKESLEVLMRRRRVPDLEDKVIQVAGMLLEMIGKTNSKKIISRALNSRKAEKKMREIIAAQGGNEKIKPEDIPIGRYKLDVTAKRDGVILWINNGSLVEVARAAGSPKNKGAGIQLYKKLGDPVKKGEKIFTVYSEKAVKLARAEKALEEETVVGVGRRIDMLIHKIKEIPVAKKRFILER